MRLALFPGAALVTLLSAACEETPEEVLCPVAEFSNVGTCADPVGESHRCEGRAHVTDEEDLVWDTNPPQSGPHDASWERQRGEHVDPVNRKNWIHNLEHGWIVLLYNCPDGCDEGLQVLRDVVAQRPDARVLLTPDPLLDPPRFAAVSWTWIYETDAPELNTFLCFVDQHEGHAPENIP
jgi:hypothetical protein